ncbi:MAG: 16S rRNA (cytidine(1402)-2'-O)-methyltransferase [Thermoleophilia bacterium]|nr:16S rRNA (cytidine(1402)-2'-O)-methyltransferase [Thermoleophilia bacterium]
MPGTLHVCAVPIGNLADASPRLREVLSSVDAIACEDTRTTGRLLELLDLPTPRPRLLAHHEHNERASAAGVVELLLAGSDVAIVSDAGTPAVSDPGVELVRAAHVAGIPVRAVAGPSSVAAAISVAGASSEHGFHFAGFLPRGDAALEELLASTRSQVVVALESPKRVRASLEVAARVQPERCVTVCRELTKLHEQVLRGTPAELLLQLGDDVKGEVVLVLDAATDAANEDDAPAPALALARDLVDAGVRSKDSAKLAARHVGGRSRAIYDALVAERRD